MTIDPHTWTTSPFSPCSSSWTSSFSIPIAYPFFLRTTYAYPFLHRACSWFVSPIPRFSFVRYNSSSFPLSINLLEFPIPLLVSLILPRDLMTSSPTQLCLCPGQLSFVFLISWFSRSRLIFSPRLLSSPLFGQLYGERYLCVCTVKFDNNSSKPPFYCPLSSRLYGLV